MGKAFFFASETNQINDFRHSITYFTVCHAGNLECKGDVFKHRSLRKKLEILKDYPYFASQQRDMLVLERIIINATNDNLASSGLFLPRQ